MRSTFQNAGQFLTRIIDFFYPPFRKYMNIQFFRYGFTGSVNVAFSQVLYYIVYNWLLHQKLVYIGSFPVSSHTAALLITFPFANFFGFLLQKYVTFSTSNLRGRTQLYRYFIVVFLNLGINYVFLTLFVKGFHFWAVPSQMLATCICIAVSYFSQKKFTFKHKKRVHH